VFAVKVKIGVVFFNFSWGSSSKHPPLIDQNILKLNLIHYYYNVLGVLFTMELYCTPKVNTLQLNTVGNSWNTRTRPTRTVSEHSLL
jgi:hypothetical protein